MLPETQQPTHPEPPPAVRYYDDAGPGGCPAEAEALLGRLELLLQPLLGVFALATPLRLTIEALGRRAELLVGDVRADGKVGPPAAQAFVPTVFQRAILDALDGRGLRTDALGSAV